MLHDDISSKVNRPNTHATREFGTLLIVWCKSSSPHHGVKMGGKAIWHARPESRHQPDFIRSGIPIEDHALRPEHIVDQRQMEFMRQIYSIILTK